LSLRDVAEMFLARGFVFTHETVRDWEARFAPLIADQLRTKRRGQAGISWYVDETYIKVRGKWCYLYRAIDHDGNLVDSRLSEKRDMDAAKQFLAQAFAVVGHAPEMVTTDGHRSYPRAVCETLGSAVGHRTNKYLNNRLEQDHCGIKQRYYPMCGFKTFEATARFCCDARRITQLSPSASHHGRTDFTPRTAASVPPPTRRLEGIDTGSFLARDEEHRSIQ
jgi:transposase-like protein